MGWIGLVAAVFIVAVVVGALRVKRPPHDLGAVSDQWIAQHRSQPR